MTEKSSEISGSSTGEDPAQTGYSKASTVLALLREQCKSFIPDSNVVLGHKSAKTVGNAAGIGVLEAPRGAGVGSLSDIARRIHLLSKNDIRD